MGRFKFGVLGCIVGALAGLCPVGWTLGFFGHVDFSDYSLIGSVVGAVAGLLFGPWFVSGAFVGVLGSFLGGLVGSGVRYLYVQHLSAGNDMGYDYGAGYWVMYGIVGGAIVGILLGLWLVAHLRELQRVRARRP